MSDTMHPFSNVSSDDADHLLFMVAEAHKPFSASPISIGDIATEWATRWKRAQPKTARPVGERLNPAFAAMRDAYGPQARAEAEGFSFDEAVRAIETRWPGIRIGEPEREWSQRPVIAELARMRLAVQKSDPNQAGEAVSYRHRAPEIAR